MKRFSFILLLFSSAAIAQKLKHNEYDKYTKQWRLETFPVNVKTADDIQMDLSLSYVDTAFFVNLTGSGIGANIAGVNDPVIFLLDNDSTVTAKSPAVQVYDYSKPVYTYKHDYLISLKDLKYLSQHNLQALRKYSTEKYDDIYFDAANAGKLKELTASFLEELKKGDVLKPKAPAIAPHFPGGADVFTSFLNRNLKPPPELKTGERKLVVVQFTVKANGSIDDVQIKESPGPSFENEILRVLQRMPRWKPGIDEGQPVDAIVTRTLSFFRPPE